MTVGVNRLSRCRNWGKRPRLKWTSRQLLADLDRQLLDPQRRDLNRINNTGQIRTQTLGGYQIAGHYDEACARFRFLGCANNADDLIDRSSINMIKDENASLESDI